jgi:tetratricopeptide (TPR) repeat protein
MRIGMRQTGFSVTIICSAILIGLVLVAYHAAPENTFHFDDYPNIVTQAALQIERANPSALLGAALGGAHPTRPVANLTLAFDWWRGGGSPRPFQWTNLLIHVMGALLVFALFRMALALQRSPGDRFLAVSALFGAAWWALHPIQVQAVTYIIQRMASLSAVLVVAAVLAYIHGRRDPVRRWRWVAVAALCSLLAALTKENAWVLPVLILLAEFSLVRTAGRLVRSRLDVVLILVPVFAGLYLLGALATETGPISDWIRGTYQRRAFTMEERLLTQPRVIVFHFSQLIWPLPGRFSIEHAFSLSRNLFTPVMTLPALMLVCVWISVGLWCLASPVRRVAGFFILWVPLTLAIESSIIGLELVFEHRMYLPTVGIAGLLAIGFRWVLTRTTASFKAATVALCTASIAGLLVSTLVRVPEWASDVTLMERAYDRTPKSPRVIGNLGAAYLNAGKLETAGDLLQRATELDPEWPQAWYNLATWHARLRHTVAAEAAYRRALQLTPESALTWQSLGDLYRESGQARKATMAYGEALRIAPQRTDALRRRGRLLSDAFGQHDAALRDLNQARMLGGNSYSLLVDRGAVLGRLSRAMEAVADFTAAIRLKPQEPRAYYNRGLTYLNIGDNDAARQDFSTAVQFDPFYADAYVGLASVSLMQGRPAEARAGFEHALSLDPDHVDARFNLGVTMEVIGDLDTALMHYRKACADGHQRACAKYQQDE